MQVLIFVVLGALFGHLSGRMVRARGRNYGAYFLLSVLVSPFVTWILLAIIGESKLKRETDNQIAQAIKQTYSDKAHLSEVTVKSTDTTKTTKKESLLKILDSVLAKKLITIREYDFEKQLILHDTSSFEDLTLIYADGLGSK